MRWIVGGRVDCEFRSVSLPSEDLRDTLLAWFAESKYAASSFSYCQGICPVEYDMVVHLGG